jgi:hypothetical protein
MNGVTTAALAASYTLLIFLVLELAIEPRLFRHRYLVSPLLVVLLILVLAEAFGLLGLLLAPPLAAAIQILLGNLLEQPIPAGTEHDQQAVHIADLQERITAVRGLAEDTEAAASPEIKNLLDRLSHLMDQANRGL